MTGGVVYSHLIDHHVHDGLGNTIADILTHNREIGFNKITNGLHLSLELRVNGILLSLQKDEVLDNNSSQRPGSGYSLPDDCY